MSRAAGKCARTTPQTRPKVFEPSEPGVGSDDSSRGAISSRWMAALLARPSPSPARSPSRTTASEQRAPGEMTSPPSRSRPPPPPPANGHANDHTEDSLLSMEGGQTKRRKVAVACEACRERKVRCDGAHPICGTCAKRRSTTKCVYSTIRDETQLASKEYVERLEARLRHLEGDGSTSVEPSHKVEAVSPQLRTQTVPDGHPGERRSLLAHYTPITIPTQPAPSQCFPSPPSAGPTRRWDESRFEAMSSPEIRRSELTASGHRGPERLGSRDGRHRSISIAGTHLSDSAASDLVLAAPRESEDVDGMGAVDEEPMGQRTLGSSSAANFMKQIKAVIGSRMEADPLDEPADPRIQSLAGPNTRTRAQSTLPEDFILPSRRTADTLMEVYWAQVHTLYPFLHRPSFMFAYDRIWNGEGDIADERWFYCLLNAALAIACQLSDSIEPKSRGKSAAVFFERANTLLQPDLLGPGSFHSIQALLLMAQYLQSTHSPHRCWIVMGLAIRIAQNLGLDLPDTAERLQCQRDQEMARRVWHGCLLLDKVLSMTLGRPATLSQASAIRVAMPAPIDDQFLSVMPGQMGFQPSELPSQMAFFNASVRLYHILGDVLAVLYNPLMEELQPQNRPSLNVSSEDWNAIPRLNQALTEWWDRLPPFIHFANMSTTDQVFVRQANVLRSRYLHLRTLLFRPILRYFVVSQAGGSASNNLAFSTTIPYYLAEKCAIMCVSSAQQLIQLIHSNFKGDGSAELLPAWWYNVFYTFTAAINLLAGRLCPTIVADVSEASLAFSWSLAIEILRGYETFNRGAQRCAATLELLDEKIKAERQAPSQHNVSQGPSIPTANNVPNAPMGMAASVMGGAQNNMAPGPTDVPNGFGIGLQDLPPLMDLQDLTWMDNIPSDLNFDPTFSY